jgi:hypothetical protein
VSIKHCYDLEAALRSSFYPLSEFTKLPTMNFSSRFVKKALAVTATLALTATNVIILPAIGQAQPKPSSGGRPPSGSTRPTKPASPTQPAANGKWQEFKSATGKFAISMPTKPEESVNNGAYIFKSVGQELYILTYSDNTDAAVAQEAIKVVPEALVEQLKAKMVRSQDIKIRNYSGREFEFVVESNNSKGKGRVYAVGKRLFMLVTSNTGADGDRYFKSFRLL